MATLESAQKNRQFGGTMFFFGLLGLAFYPVLSWLEPVPADDDLLREEVRLASSVRLIEGRGVRAEFSWTDGKNHSFGRIPSVAICVSAEAKEKLVLARPGARLFVEAQPIGNPQDREYEIWSIRVDGEPVIEFASSVAAHQYVHRNYLYLTSAMTVVGLPLLILGYRQKATLEASRGAA
jgi:hypothetical protein